MSVFTSNNGTYEHLINAQFFKLLNPLLVKESTLRDHNLVSTGTLNINCSHTTQHQFIQRHNHVTAFNDCLH